MIKFITLILLACLCSIASFAVSPISGIDTVCAGSSRTLTDATAGGTWSSSNTAVATVGSTTGIVTGVTAGFATITYQVGTAIATVTFVVNPVAAPISGAATVAAGSAITLSDAVGGGTWYTSNASVASIGSATGIVTGVAPGSCTVYYVTSGGCGTYIIFTVTGSTSVSGISGIASVCAGNNRTLTDSTAGGHWSSSNTSIATVGSSTGIVAGVAAGTCTITYMVGTAVTTITFTVNPAPSPISGSTTVAAGGTTSLSDLVTGGTWSSNNTSVATVGSSSAIVTGISGGSATIYYITPGGCYGYTVVTVSGSVSVHGISGITSVCVGATTALSDSTSGGHWTSSNTSIATVGSSTGIVTGVSSGICTISYTLGTSTATITITVNPAAAPISGSTTVSVGSTVTMSDAVSGGTWSTSNASVASAGSSTGIVTGVSAGTATIYYRTPGGCYTYVIVTVTGGTSIHGISGMASLCAGSTTTLSDSTSGGHWSSSNISIATVGSSSGVVTGVAAGTCIISYTVGASSVTITVTVNPAALPISGITTLAVGSSITMSDAVSGGTWSTSNASIASVGSSTGIVTGVFAGTATIYYRTPGGCYTYVIVTVTATTSIHGITGTANACVGSTRTLEDSTTGGHWSSSNTAIASVGSSTGIVTGISAGTCIITYAVGTGYVTITFTVNPAAPISGSTTVAAGYSVALSDAVSGGTWLSSNTAVATVGSSTGIVTGVTPGTATIYYITSAPCYSYIIVTVTASTAIHSISGTANACVGSTRTLADSTTGGHWSSSNTAVATVGSSTGIVTGISVGTCTITYTVGAGFVTITFTVGAAPGPISGGTSVAIGSTLALTDAATGGTWLSSNTSIATVGSSTGIVTGIAAGSANIYYLTAGGCGAYVIITVTGGTTLHGITGTTSACAGSTRTLADSTAGGHWSSSNMAVATVGSSTGVVTGVSAGTATITYTVGASITTVTFTVYPDAGPIMGSSSVSTGTTATLSDAVPGGMWSSSNTSVATVGATSGIVEGVAAGTVNIYYITPGGCATYHLMTVIASPGFSLYPNPVAERVTLSWQDQTTGTGTVTISDMAGHIVYTSPIDMTEPGGQIQIPVSNLKNGIYLYDIVSGNTHTAGRINVLR